jgi:hypothetical protein
VAPAQNENHGKLLPVTYQNLASPGEILSARRSHQLYQISSFLDWRGIPKVHFQQE